MHASELLELQAEVFGAAFMLTQYLTRHADEALVPLELTTRQWLLLAVLVKRFQGESPSLSEAATAYGSSRQNVKQIARQLEERGYLRLLPDPDDRRTLRLQLTPKVGVFDRPDEQHRLASLMAGLFEGFEPAELQYLHHLMRRWLRVVAPT